MRQLEDTVPALGPGGETSVHETLAAQPSSDPAGGIPAMFVRRAWLLWGALRIVGLLGLSGAFPYNRTVESNADISLYYTWPHGLWRGDIPYHPGLLQQMYPPGILPFIGLPSFSHMSFQIEFLFAAFVVDALVMRALLRDGRRIGSVVWIFASLLLGPVFWCRFDIFIAAMLIAAVLAFEKRHYGRASFWIAWAGLIKIWPLLLLVLLYRLVPTERRRGYVVVGATIVTVCVTPFVVLGGTSGLLSVAQSQAGRGVEIESLFAAPLYILAAAGHHVPIIEATGSLQFAGPVEAVLASTSTILIAWAVAYLLWRGLVRPTLGWDAARWLLLVVVLLLLTDRVLSPQYMVWTAAAVALFVDRCRWRQPLLGATALLLVATQMQFPFGYLQLEHSNGLALPLSAFHGVVFVGFVIIALRCVQGRDGINRMAPLLLGYEGLGPFGDFRGDVPPNPDLPHRLRNG